VLEDTQAKENSNWELLLAEEYY